jgi:hypothetical protein
VEGARGGGGGEAAVEGWRCGGGGGAELCRKAGESCEGVDGEEHGDAHLHSSYS